jgi:hypothetical protein
MDAPKLTKSMQITTIDLGLLALKVVYPGKLAYPLALNMMACPLHDCGDLFSTDTVIR